MRSSTHRFSLVCNQQTRGKPRRGHCSFALTSPRDRLAGLSALPTGTAPRVSKADIVPIQSINLQQLDHRHGHDVEDHASVRVLEVRPFLVPGEIVVANLYLPVYLATVRSASNWIGASGQDLSAERPAGWCPRRRRWVSCRSQSNPPRIVGLSKAHFPQTPPWSRHSPAAYS